MVSGQLSSGFVSRSHQAILPFDLLRPDDIAAADALVKGGARVHAGGIDLVAEMQRGEPVGRVVSLADLPELGEIEVVGPMLRIGAMATHHAVETSDVIAAHRSDLQVAWQTVGNVRIRRTGTVGGNLLSRDPGYDAAPILAAAGAEGIWADGTRVSIAHPHTWPEGLLAAVDVPLDGEVRMDRSLKPVVSVVVGPAGVAVGCAYESVRLFDPGLDDLPEPIDDAFGSSVYRARMIRVLARRLAADT